MNRQINPAKTRDGLPRAIVKKDHLSQLLWLIPVCAALLCGWFAYHDFIATGPLITVSFAQIEGLQKQNTPLLYRGVTVGAVTGMELAKDEKRVNVNIRLTGAAKGMARTGSSFWIVHPDVRIGAISGLRTLVSGEYIEVRPGNGAKTNLFIGMPSEPLSEDAGALKITLTSPHRNSLQEQSPIFYRGIQVGEVIDYQLAEDSRNVVIHARVWHDYTALVHVDSKFWNAGGLAVHFGLFKGLQISAESPKTIITGGLEFATPPESAMAASDGATYSISDKAEEKWKEWNPVIKLTLPDKSSAQMTLQTNVWPMLENP